MLDTAEQKIASLFGDTHRTGWYKDRSVDISTNAYLTDGDSPMERYILTVGLDEPDSTSGYVYVSLFEQDDPFYSHFTNESEMLSCIDRAKECWDTHTHA